MKLIWRIFGIIGMIGLPPLIVWRVLSDLQHPELWNDPNHNPYLSAALAGVGVVLAVWLGWMVP